MSISTRQFMSPIALTVALLACGASGCGRYGYTEQPREPDKERDAGLDSGSQAGTSAGAGGAAGMPSDAGGRGGAGAGGSGGGGRDASQDSGMDIVDAGVRDASDDDAGADDAGVDPSGGCTDHPGAIFCDGFEALNFSEKWSYPQVSAGASLGRSTARKYKGEASLRATTGPAMAGNEARYAASVLGKQKSGDIWMRYYYFLPKSVVINAHFSAGVMSEIEEPWAGFALLVRSSSVDLTSMAGPFQGSKSFPRDEWVCVELHVRIDPKDGVFEGYLNKALVVTSGPANTVPADGFMNAEVGIHYAEAGQGPVEVFVDDVVIARTRVPCD